ncbi:MAG: ABC transporter ATP-binding protein [Sedimentisphaerales bacterium]|nr:ABC transporter ATP-binding protein [Sedimentisphaerales bacterium]MBN2842564.1 ABC transporter ATP-binding protein [Sedimentisphaerales bacterium]
MLEVKGIRKSFKEGNSRHDVLRGLDLSVDTGDFLAIMGASGSGKSTLLHIMGLLDKPDNGKVYIDGIDASSMSGRKQDKIRNEHTGFVFQFYHLLPELNALENIMLPLMIKTPAYRWLFERRKAIRRSEELLEMVGLSERARQNVTTLSGGERQRIALARALANNPKLLLADEPTGNLDHKAGSVILDILGELNRQGQTIVMVTHDRSIAELARRTVTLVDGELMS